MLFVLPTSGDTALIWQASGEASAAYTLIANAVLIAAAFCLWEMAIASLRRRPVPMSRWALVVAIATGFAASGLLFASPFGFGTVTFNDGELTTTWALVIESWVALASVIVSAVLVALRFADALKEPKTGRVPYVAWWLSGIAITAAYAVLINRDAYNGAALSGPATVIGIVLLAVAAAVLFAVAMVHRRRADDLPAATPRPDRPSRRQAPR